MEVAYGGDGEQSSALCPDVGLPNKGLRTSIVPGSKSTRTARGTYLLPGDGSSGKIGRERSGTAQREEDRRATAQGKK